MSELRFYMDEHVPKAVTIGLRVRGFDVLTAQEDRRTGTDDAALLDRAAELGRVLVTQDDDFLVEAHARQRDGVAFSGVVYSHQLRLTIGEQLQDLEILASACSAEEMESQVLYLPI